MTTYGFDEQSVRRIVKAVRQTESSSRTRPQPRARWGGGRAGLKAIEGFLSSALTGASGTNGETETTATMDIWRGDASSWADTGDNATITNRAAYMTGPSGAYVLAVKMGGEYRPIVIDCAQRNEIQQIVISGTPTGGTFTITYDGQTTGTIAYNASAATVQSALEALSNIAVGDVVCTGGAFPGTAVLVEFAAALANMDVAQMTVGTNSLTGGTSPTVTISTTQPGCCG